MYVILSRINKNMRRIVSRFKKDCSFSIYYAFLRIIDVCLGAIGLTEFSDKVFDKRMYLIEKVLEQELSDVIKTQKVRSRKGIHQEDCPIWVCWWTGEDSAPPIVKKCIYSIRKNAGTHPVYIISQDNYSDFLNIPQNMLNSVESGSMGLAHLADYIRVALLYKYGGLWLDATIYCSQEIPESFFENSFFTCKSEYKECRYVSKMRWGPFVIGGWKGNDVFLFLKDALEIYWNNHSVDIDYLFLDNIIELGFKKIPHMFEEIESVPLNNLHRDDLIRAMYLAFPAEKMCEILNSDTVLYKLSWKDNYSLVSPNGEESVYQAFLKMP